MMGVRAALFLLLLALGVASGAPPSPAGTKRSIEDIQFGNQQNPPVGLLDDNALPGPFPSSETSEESVAEMKSTVEPTQLQQEQQLPQQANHPLQQEDSQEDEEAEDQQQRQQENEGEPLEPVAQPSRWHDPNPAGLRAYRPHWGPLLYGRSTYPTRRRRSVHQRRPAAGAARPDPRVVPQVSLNALRAGQRHKRDLRRFRRDLRPNTDLETLLREIELVTMLQRQPHYNPGGYGTVHYSPAPPRYAPQPKLFPDDDEEDESEDGSPLGLLQQNLRGHHLSDAVIVPAGTPGRVWRRSGPGPYSLSSVPGFKRSAFRSNNPPQAAPPPPPPQVFTQADLYNLAAMLGAELDPVTHRLRRAAM